MSTATTTRTPTDVAPPWRGAGVATLAFGLLMFVPLIVLGAAIGRPGSLSEPAADVLPRIAENAAAVRIGYLVYLGYSVLFAVMVALLLRLVEDQVPPGVRRLITGFAIASVVARCLGIVRWLGPMPLLADSYGAADTATRADIARTYDALNSYGGIIGEALGVGVFAAISLGLLSVGLLRTRSIPRPLAIGSVLAAFALLMPAAELAGIDLGPALSAAVSVLQVWAIALGAWLLLRGNRVAATAR